MGNCCTETRNHDGTLRLGDLNLDDERLRVLAKQDLKISYTKEQRVAHAPKDPAIIHLKEIPQDLISNIKSPCYPLGPFNFDKDEPDFHDLPVLGPYQMEKGSVYLGQFKNGKRHGTVEIKTVHKKRKGTLRFGKLRAQTC